MLPLQPSRHGSPNRSGKGPARKTCPGLVVTGSAGGGARHSPAQLLACERDDTTVVFTIFPEIAGNVCISTEQMEFAMKRLWERYPDPVISRASWNFASGLCVDRDATEFSAPLTKANVNHMDAPPAHRGCGPDHFFLVVQVIRQPGTGRAGMVREAWCLVIAIRPARILRVLWFLPSGRNVEVHFRNWTKVSGSVFKGYQVNMSGSREFCTGYAETGRCVLATMAYYLEHKKQTGKLLEGRLDAQPQGYRP